MNKVFVAVYTNKVKSYCDEELISSLKNLTYPNIEFHIVDNTIGLEYHNRLKSIVPSDWQVTHLNISEDPKHTQFHRNVYESVNFLREEFLKSSCDYFLIIESDVIVPSNTIEMFLEVKDKADLIGGLYYWGYHKDKWFVSDEFVIPTDQTILSGCTFHSRRLLEEVVFRYDENNLAPFPDAFMSIDTSGKGFVVGNYCKIKCKHLPGRSSNL